MLESTFNSYGKNVGNDVTKELNKEIETKYSYFEYQGIIVELEIPKVPEIKMGKLLIFVSAIFYTSDNGDEAY